MKALVIIPKNDGFDSGIEDSIQARIFPPVGLARMAGILGKHASVSVIDERIRADKHETITALTVIYVNSYNLHRALALCSHYKHLGSFVILTGVVPEYISRGILQQADCLFVGAGENCIEAFLVDYFKRSAKRIYHAATHSAYRSPFKLAS